MPRTNWKDMGSYSIVIPDKEILDFHTKIVKYKVEKIISNIWQTKYIKSLRDTLLPKLISGQIRLPEAEALINDSSSYEKIPEEQLEQAIIELVAEQGIPHTHGETLTRPLEQVLLPDDLRAFLRKQYQTDGLTEAEIDRILRKLQSYPATDLYHSNRSVLRLIADGYIFKRDDHQQKDLFIRLIDYSEADANTYRIVNQLVIEGNNRRIPDAILYINGLPLVVFEFKSAIRDEVQLHDAYYQLTVTYRRDIPELFKYNAFCVISDGANTKAGSLFAPYDYFYAWRRIAGSEGPVDGIPALHTLIQGMLERSRLRDIIQNFIYLPDKSQKEEKIVCRYPQYYAARALFNNIKAHQKPEGDGKGGTYFGATGSGKSYTMLFLVRLLMKSPYFKSPTIVLITDRTDLDDQLSTQLPMPRLSWAIRWSKARRAAKTCGSC
jgi:type I restriction enzyme R subunit